MLLRLHAERVRRTSIKCFVRRSFIFAPFGAGLLRCASLAEVVPELNPSKLREIPRGGGSSNETVVRIANDSVALCIPCIRAGRNKSRSAQARAQATTGAQARL